MVFFNLMLLAVTAFIPLATFLYGVTLTASTTCCNLLLDHLVRRRAFVPEVTEQCST